MKRYKENEEFPKPHKHEKLLTFICFATAALVGYFLTNYVALISA